MTEEPYMETNENGEEICPSCGQPNNGQCADCAYWEAVIKY